MNMKKQQRWHGLIGIAISLVLAACASLPDVDDLGQQKTVQAKPTVIGQHGELPPQRSAEILRRLQTQQEGKSDLLQHHFEFMQALNPAPLWTGNAVRLLADGTATFRAMFDAIRSARDHI